ncbi:MAG: TetR family transcriptional regulator C-terminal domain-containing protein [Actinomycetota bacterium]
MPPETAERLTDAIMLAIREHGYVGTSMQNLLRDTGVSSSSMYHFFPGGKEELAAEAIRRSGLDAARRIAEVFEQHDAAEGISRIFAAAAAEMEGHDYTLGCPIGVPATEAAADSALIREAVGEVFTAWADAYTAALRASGVPDDRATSLGRFIISAYEGSVTLARATRTTQPYFDATAVITAQLQT